MSQRSRFIFRVLLIAGSAIGLYIFLFHSPFFSLKNLEIQGRTSISVELIKHTISIPWGKNIWWINRRAIASEIERNWFVKVVGIKRKLPSTLVVKIRDQIPVALVKSQNGTWLLSGSGLLWPLLKEPFVNKFSNLCKIAYPEGKISWFPGKKTGDKNLRMALSLLRSLGRIEELKISDSDITVFFLNFKIIFPRSGSLEDKLRNLKAVLDRFSSRKGKWVIDLRFRNMVIVRERGK